MPSFWERSSITQKQPPEVYYKKGVLKNFAKLTGKHLCQSLFLNKAASTAYNFIKKETLAQVFSCEFCKIFKNPFLTEHPWTTTSDYITLNLKFFSQPPTPTQCPPSPPFCRGEGSKIFSILAKTGGLAVSDFLGRGQWVKMGEWIFSEGGWGFSESNFQLLIKYHIRSKNVNYSHNHNHNVFYLLTISSCLWLVY